MRKLLFSILVVAIVSFPVLFDRRRSLFRRLEEIDYSPLFASDQVFGPAEYLAVARWAVSSRCRNGP